MKEEMLEYLTIICINFIILVIVWSVLECEVKKCLMKNEKNKAKDFSHKANSKKRTEAFW